MTQVIFVGRKEARKERRKEGRKGKREEGKGGRRGAFLRPGAPGSLSSPLCISKHQPHSERIGLP